MRVEVKRDFVDEGFGFPVVIDRVEIARENDRIIPLIDYDHLADSVARALVHKRAPLSGNEVRFLRLHFGMTLSSFAQIFGVTHAAVKKWEQKANKPTGMNPCTELILRLWGLHELGEDLKDVLSLRECLVQDQPAASEPIHVSLESAWSLVGQAGKPREAARARGQDPREETFGP